MEILMDIANILKGLGTLYIFVLRYPFTLVTLAFLSIATYYDVKEREIDEKLYLAVIPPAAAVFALMHLAGWLSVVELLVSGLATAIVALATYLLAREGMIGYGDVFLVAAVGLLNPHLVKLGGFYATPLMLSVLFGSAYLIPIVALNLVHNLRRKEMFREAAKNLTKWETAFYMLVGRVMTAEEFRRSRFYFPLVADGIKRKMARVGVEPLEGSEHDVAGMYIIATYGFPFAAVLLVGYAITVSIMFYGFLGEIAHSCTCCR